MTRVKVTALDDVEHLETNGERPVQIQNSLVLHRHGDWRPFRNLEGMKGHTQTLPQKANDGVPRLGGEVDAQLTGDRSQELHAFADVSAPEQLFRGQAFQLAGDGCI